MSENTNRENVPVAANAKPKFDMRVWWENRTIGEKIGLGIGMTILSIAGMAVFTAVFMILWNAIIPSIFGAGQVNYWQALGILVLSWIVFGTRSPSGNNSKKARYGRANA